MNKIILNLILGFTFLSVYSQNTQSFTRDFRTSSGIYGYVEILTQPTGFGTLAIQQKRTVVQGINNFNGNSLSEYGISFPFNCSNCFFYADGSVSMQIRDVIGRSSGSFSKGGTINLNSGLNRTINWYAGVAEKHNEIRRKYNDDNYWEANGRVESLNIYSVKGADFGNITRAVDKYNKAKQKADKFNNLISQASNSSLSDNQKLSYLNQAKQYAQTSAEQNQVNTAINNLNQQIQQKKQQNQNTTTSTTTQSIGNISSVSSNTSTSTSTTSQKQIMYDANGLPTTPAIEAIKARSQAKYERNMQKVQVISNAVTGLVNYFEQQRQQRLAYEERQRQLKAQEERKKELFRSQVSQYRSEYKKIINARKSFLNQVKLNSTLDEDGTGFKPLYIYFAYVPKNYDYYYENVSYPSTLDFKINQNIDVKFSPVFGFFPYSNGQYPFIRDIKNQILYDHFGNKVKDYDVVFFQWKNSVEDVVSSLKGNLNKAVNESYFANAIPSSNNEIVFLNSKVNASQSKDYWTGKKVKTKNSKKVDYFNTDKKQSSNKKTDYWKTNKLKKTQKDTVKTKKNKVNYWDN
tara:strand:+ start:700 stop:2427 length:1728 start_codon:yes stop_codon:yes gene_type:complete